MRAILSRFLYVKKAGAWRTGTDYRQKAILPRRGRIAQPVDKSMQTPRIHDIIRIMIPG